MPDAVHDLNPLRIGIDLGGTKTEIIALGAGGVEAYRKRVPSARSFEDSVRTMAGLVLEAEDALGARGTVGVGIPGVTVPGTGLIKNANSTWLIGRPLEGELERALEREVRVMNDANCFALSEASDGAGAGVSSVFGVILGTGVGGGIVLDGKILSGANLIAGEWGHNPLPIESADEFPGPECYCGRHGCIETWLSGPGLAADHQRVTGEALDGRAIGAAAVAGDPKAVATLERHAARLARALGVVVNVLDPDVFVLGGGVSNLPGLAEAAEAQLLDFAFSDGIETRVLKNLHGDSSGVRGAAWLWSEDEARR